MNENQEQIEQLIILAKDGDSRAFSELYDRFAGAIYRFINMKLRHREQSEDVLQEVFIKAWRGLSGFEVKQGHFSAWLYRIATNAVNDHFRKAYRKPENLELNENMEVYAKEETSEEMDKAQDFSRIKNALEFLPIKYKEVLELRYVQDLTIEETSFALKKSKLAVRLSQHRALKKLREILGEENATR
jgi:RNA polymerase sigma-70 factor, ECF subfamily